MNQHPTIGAEIVAPASQLADEAPLIRSHHEWFNGSGYPDGIEALTIPLGARILTIADAYEAMTSSRPYRKIPLTHEQAAEQLTSFIGHPVRPRHRAGPAGARRRHPAPASGSARRAADHAPRGRPAALARAGARRSRPLRARRRRRQRRGRCWPRTMFLSTILAALIVGALLGGRIPRLADLNLKWPILLIVALGAAPGHRAHRRAEPRSSRWAGPTSPATA